VAENDALAGASTDKLSGDALASEAGVVARFKTPSESIFSVAPSTATGNTSNSLRKPLRPSACFRIDDLRFDFDSSFIKPDAAEEFALLASVRSPTATGEAALLLSVFGHADPSGADDYNKTLAGRRATAVYGLLVRDAALWEELYSQPFHGDSWGIKQIQLMLRALQEGSATLSGFLDQPTTAAVKTFQRDAGLQQSGFPGTDTRKRLFLRYMDAICRDDSGPFSYTPQDFLSRGTSPDGKADRQGCGEFNPISIFSKADAKKFEKAQNKAERDAENLSNRRVVVYMFSPSLPIVPSSWPCPTVAEGTAKCKAQFYPDADTRRNPQDLPRQYLRAGRTMACKFYDRIARASPCEAVRQNIIIFLLGEDGQPCKNAPYRLTAGSQVREGVSDKDGRIIEPQVLAALTCEIEWGVSDDDGTGPILPNYAEIFLNASSENADAELAKRQLANLGFKSDLDRENRRAFRDDYQQADDSDAAVNAAHQTGRPKAKRTILI
jgi:hypothetical protein